MATLPPVLEAAGLAQGDCFLLFLPMSNFQQRYLCYGALIYDFDIALTDFTQLFNAIDRLTPPSCWRRRSSIRCSTPSIWANHAGKDTGRTRWGPCYAPFLWMCDVLWAGACLAISTPSSDAGPGC